MLDTGQMVGTTRGVQGTDAEMQPYKMPMRATLDKCEVQRLASLLAPFLR